MEKAIQLLMPASPELSLWNTWCGKKEEEREGGRENKDKVASNSPSQDYRLNIFCCFLKKRSHAFLMLEDGGAGGWGSGPRRQYKQREPGWIEIVQKSHLCRH